MKSIKYLLVLAFFFSLVYSCKSKDVEQPAGTNCKVSEAFSFDNNGVKDDSASYSYTGDKITKVEYSSGEYFTVQYDGDLVTRRSFYIPSLSTPTEFEQITYNADKTISKIENLEKSTTGYSIFYRTEFTYTGGKLSKLTLLSIANNVSTKEEEYTYTYNMFLFTLEVETGIKLPFQLIKKAVSFEGDRFLYISIM